jgi:hypothetical protein
LSHDRDTDTPAAALPFPDSLCRRCRFMRATGNKRGSIFLSCTEPSLPRYLPQPVRACRAFAAGAAS